MNDAQLDYIPQPRQALFHQTAAKQILYGGAAGGGKSRCLRMDIVMFCLEIPGLEAFLFRRTYGELDDNHIRPLLRELPGGMATYKPSKSMFEFINGSKIILCHAKDTLDYLTYMGAEMHILAIDEAGLFEPIQLIELRGRVRLGSFAANIKPEYKRFLPRCIFSSNPGGPSHNFLKRTFIAPAEPETLFYDATLKDPGDPNHKGWTTIYIPAKMSDNKHLDAGYGSVFSAMSRERARALREGDWDAVEGAALHLLDKQRHMIRPFDVPKHWTVFMSMDWGTARPFSIGWYTVAGEDSVVNNNPHLTSTESNPKRGIFIPKGAVIRFQEYYGWTGKENEGMRLPSNVVARHILVQENDYKIRRPDYRVGDSGMWSQHDGPSPAEKMMLETDGVVTLQKCKKDRKSNYDEINCRLAGNPELKVDGVIEEHPMFFITSNCIQAWRTLPVLTADIREPDKGPSDNGTAEDHIYDEIAYGLATRPYALTKQEREERDFFEGGGKHRKSPDIYATT